MNIFPLILLLLADSDSAKLTVVPNTKEILQRDNLLLLTVLENKSISAVKLFGELRADATWFRHEIQEKGKWVKVRPTGDQLGPFCGMGEGPFLAGQSTYAECDAWHRRSLRGAFLFEKPGTYKIRVVATMPWGELPSEPVEITVKERAAEDLKKIESLPPWDLWVLAVPSLDTPLPEKLLELQPVGGNIARTIENWQMAQTASEGGEWKGTRISKEKNCQWLREKMEPVALEHSLEHLGAYYRARKYWEGISRVAPAMQYDSMKRRAFLGQLEFLTKPPMPAKP